MPLDNNCLQVKSLAKSFGKQNVLKDISITVPSGCAYALLGPNGSGKTTVLKSLVGSVQFDHGLILFNNEIVDVKSKRYKRLITYMPQYPGFLPHLSAKESIDLLVTLRGEEPIHQEKLVKELGIYQFLDKPFGELSGGMKQKVNILQCFMFDSLITFLDEPTSSLDPHVARYVKQLIRDVKATGRTVLFTSHIMSEVEEIGDKMALLSNGEVLIEASPKEFIAEKKAKNLEAAMLQYWSGNDV